MLGWVLLLPAFAEEKEPFLRIQPRSGGGICLQVAVRSYAIGKKDQTKTITLVGVSHIGSARYYKKVQAILDKADVVLFEGVDGNHPAFIEATKEKSPERSILQANLARALGLVFQLHHIDYEKKHFVNSDLSTPQLLALFKGEDMPSGEDARKEMEQMLAGMEQASMTGRVGAEVLAFLKQHPGWSKGMRWGMIKILGSVSGNLSEYPGLPEHLRTLMTVLIEKRNEKVMQDIHTHLADLKPGQSVAVFYGAAHMHDFEVRLEKEMNVRPLENTWLTAFCANLQTSGLNLLEKQSVTWFVNQQVQAMRLLSYEPEKDE